MASNMDAWKSREIEDDGGVKSPSFIQFAKDLKKHLKKELKAVGLELEVYSVNHYEVSGFIFNPDTFKYVYFNTSDVRHTSDWSRGWLIRTAQGTKDYTGGMNNFVDIDHFANKAEELSK